MPKSPMMIVGMMHTLMLCFLGLFVLAPTITTAADQKIVMHDKLGQKIPLFIPESFKPVRLGHGNLPVGETAARIELTLPPNLAGDFGVDPLIKIRFAPPGAARNMISALATQYRRPMPTLVPGLNGYGNGAGDSVLLIEPTIPETQSDTQPALWICALRQQQISDCHITVTDTKNIETRTIMNPGPEWPNQLKKLRQMVARWQAPFEQAPAK